MKSKITYTGLLAIIAGLAMVGCADFLDRKPLQATLSDVNQSTLEGQALGLYSTAYTYAGMNTLPWLDMNSIRDDDAMKGSSQTDGAEIDTEFDTFKYTKDDWGTDTYWNDHYYLINSASKLIWTARSLKLTDEASMHNVAEAYFWRAYAYFELVKAYGEVPTYNYYYQTSQGAIKAKSSVPDVYKQIDSDLDSAVQFLPETWHTATTDYPGRLVTYTAHALWAQTYLFRANYAKVIEHANIVKNSGKYSLVPKFYDVFKEGLNGAGKNSTESILEFQAYLGSGGTNNYGSAWGTSQNVRQGGANVDWNLGWGWNVPTDKLVAEWDSTDARWGCTILRSGKSDGGPSTGGFGATLPPYNKDSIGRPKYLDRAYWNKKVYSDPQMRQYTGQIGSSGGADWINHRVIRYADILLMLAEAYNQTGDDASAQAMLNQVRARARNTGSNSNALPDVTASGALLFQAIKDERRWEFAMEGYRFYDLVRWGDANSVLAGLGYSPKCQYYPIPQPAINQFGGILVQNPNW
ncbi:MAG TPA: RagB/SusD family nutrient uptake outer membrane protein [Cyclobacteriaceae bacterium]|nr:RagB/SusD family nutrient uptake outer membrane protein [Cyclobacteriaceae bacterium]